MSFFDSSAGRPLKCPRCGASLPNIEAEIAERRPCPECGDTQSIATPHHPFPQPAETGPIISESLMLDNLEELSYELEPPVERPPYETLVTGQKEAFLSDEQLDLLSTANTVDQLAPKVRGAAADEEEESEGDPPWLTTRGVLLFPWHRNVWQRWLAMSLCIVICGEVTVFSLNAGGMLDPGGTRGVSSSMIGGVPMMIFALLISFVSLAYIISICLTVVADTAIGCHTVEAWPDADPREWIMTLRIPIVTLGFAGLLCYPVFKVFGWVLPALIVGFIAFPIILASQLETGSALVPVSFPVLSGLRSFMNVWLKFYGQSSLLALSWLLLVWMGSLYPGMAILLLGPLTAALLLVYCCLLGRVLYLTSAVEHDEVVEEE